MGWWYGAQWRPVLPPRSLCSLLVTVFAAVVACPATARAATLDVPGTFSTIQAALDAAGPGDTIEVDAGVYSEKLEFTSSGTSGGGPITLQAAPGAATPPVLDGAGVSGDNMVLVDSRSHVAVIGFEIRNNLGVNDGSGIRVIGSGTDIELRDNRIHDIRGNHAMGITVYGTDAAPIENLIIDGNEIHDCEPAQSEALTLNGNVTDFEVTDNVVRDVNSIGIDFIGGETDIQPNQNLVVRNGLVRGNTVIRANADYGGGYGGGIYVDGGRDITIENNLVTGCDLGIEIGAENQGLVTDGIVVRNNVVYENEKAGLVFGGYAQSVGRADNNVFRGNTLYKNNTLGQNGQGRFFSGGGVGEIWVQFAGDNVIENNLVYAGDENVFVASYDSNSSTGNAFDHNLYFSDAGVAGGEFSLNGTFFTGFTAWTAATGNDASSVVGDPELADAGAADFHVSSTSPAVEAGNPAFVPDPSEVDLDGSPRLSGAAVDIGADEAACGDGVPDVGEECDDGNAVDGDGCDGNCTVTACGNGIATPSTGEQCDDGNTAGGDCCDGGCQFEAVASPCDDGEVCTIADACDGAGVCAASTDPDPTCTVPLQAGGSVLKLRDGGANDKLSWKWGKGPAVGLATLGDPVAGDDYTLCVYEQTGGVGAVVFGIRSPGGGKWRDLGAKGFKYKDGDLLPDGVRLVQVRPGAEHKAKMKLKARGGNVGLSGLGFGAATTVTAQLRGETGACFGASYSAPFKRDDAEQFNDRSD